MGTVPLYKTRMGQQFYERTVPDLVQQLQRLNESLERIVVLVWLSPQTETRFAPGARGRPSPRAAPVAQPSH